MKYKFNPYERAVGLFLTVAVTGSVAVGIGVAVRKHWFEERVPYITYIETAANLRVGSSVFMSGLRVGKIDRIELHPVHKVKVTFTIVKEYAGQLTRGAAVELARPFIIGDKALTLVPGEPDAGPLAANDVLPVRETLDLLEALAGRKLEGVLAKVDSILTNLDGTLALGRDIAHQVGDKKKLRRAMEDLTFASGEVRKVLPHLTSSVPGATRHLNKTIENLSQITTALKDLQPEGSEKTIELLTESVITLKGIQKSFFLRGNVEEAREELAKKEKAPAPRAPASE
jgi:phospholipid/cholesterol/gamma-HCH transport system substrate-binding protein